jgi:hypothetical protein
MSEASEQSPLRDRLLALRADLIARLTQAEIIEPAWLAVLADTETVLAAIDRDPQPERGGQ